MNRKQAIEILKEIARNPLTINESHLKREEAIRVLEEPLTLADFLGWEEGVEYDFEDLYVLKVENNTLFMKSEECSSGWCNFALFTDRLEDLRQAKKIEPKLKAYRVKDEYSYKCLMEELEEQGYTSIIGTKPTLLEFWENYKQRTVIYCNEDKSITYSHLADYEIDEKDKYELIEYHKEEPLYYAKIKGWELYKDNDRSYYWKYYIENELFASYNDESEHYKTKFTKSEWNELGINDTNADWEEVEE